MNSKPTGQSWAEQMATIHCIWFDKTGIEISLPIHFALKKILEHFKAEREAAVIKELRAIRAQYDNMESFANGLEATGQGKDYDNHVGWKAWKGIRNVITDRIEELTGKRQ